MEKILIVDDEPFIRNALMSILNSLGYNPTLAENGIKAIEIIKKENPDIVLLDVKMPEMDGITTLKKIREISKDILVIMLTAYGDEETMKQCAEAGADDFLVKPIDITTLDVRLKLAKKVRLFYSFRDSFLEDLKTSYKVAEENINKLLQENKDLSMELLERINLIAEFRDDETHEHTIRVGALSYEIANALELSLDYCYSLKLAAPLHDIGKVGIPDSILLKPAKLTPEEFEIMKKHTIIGWNILKNSKSSILQIAEKVAISHHERWDGTGYPYGLKGENIPLEGRIVCIADAIDAMFSKRPYKGPMPEEKVREELLKCKGTHFDPTLVDKTLEIWDNILRIERKTS